MKDQKGYSTSDLYIAAALIQLTGLYPEFNKIVDFKRVYVSMSWPDCEALQPFIDDIKALTVNVLAFKEIHYEIKTKCLGLIKEGAS